MCVRVRLAGSARRDYFRIYLRAGGNHCSRFQGKAQPGKGERRGTRLLLPPEPHALPEIKASRPATLSSSREVTIIDRYFCFLKNTANGSQCPSDPRPCLEYSDRQRADDPGSPIPGEPFGAGINLRFDPIAFGEK